jgi:murein DD-endopeptidase MepM/ murein hydrolase activator NlpD
MSPAAHWTLVAAAAFANCAHGRFLSTDPVHADANTGAYANRYAYANNAPLSFTDPDGRWGLKPYHQVESAQVPPTPGPAIAVLPTNIGKVTSPYGPRVHPVTGKPGLHNGTDFRARRGHAVRATQNGQVVRIASRGAGGNTILVHNHDGSLSGYAHTKPIDGLAVGDAVRRGERIGTSDGSGRITAPHLHYTYRPGTLRTPASEKTQTADPMTTQLKRRAR